MDKLIEGEWYWVRRYGGKWFPAMHLPRAAGGWTNEDTWEDFNKEIVDFIHILRPAEVVE
jgi:hypothetical protein